MSIGSNRPGTGRAVRRPAATSSGVNPTAMQVSAASSAFAALYRPPIPTSIATPRQVNECDVASTRSSATSSRVHVATGRATVSASNRPCTSSTFTTPRSLSDESNSSALAAKYRSTVPWRSRWSRPRLVNAATSKWAPATRSITRACDDTSITTASTPSSRQRASWRCSTGASGVVCRPDSVPSTSTRRPVDRNTSPTSCDVVVLPLVPVTPTISSASHGCPWNAAATQPVSARAEVVTTWGTSIGRVRSTRIAAAPAATAAAANSCPS